MNGLITGAIAGLLATIPMTMMMKALHAQLPREERYPLPPRLIVESASEKVEVRDDLDEEDKFAATLIAHFGYGATTGALYKGVLEAAGIKPTASNGVVYGLGVWTLSYLGVLPAMGLLATATEHPARRNALMIASHVVWGAALGATARRLNGTTS